MFRKQNENREVTNKMIKERIQKNSSRQQHMDDHMGL